jgi:hypothetical protein
MSEPNDPLASTRLVNITLRQELFEELTGRLALELDRFASETKAEPAQVAVALQFYVGYVSGLAGFAIRGEDPAAQAIPTLMSGYEIGTQNLREEMAGRRAAEVATQDALTNASRIIVPEDPLS